MQISRRDTVRSLELLAAMLVGLVLGRWALSGGFDEPVAPPAPTVAEARPEPAQAIPELRGTPLYLSGRQPMVVDAGGGPARQVQTVGVQRTTALRQGRFLVLVTGNQSSAGRVAVVELGHPGPPRTIGTALGVLPSPRLDRLWLVDQQANSPKRTFLLQEVGLADGRTLARTALPYDAAPVAVVDQGVVVRDLQSGLELRDPASGKVRQRLGGGLTLVDAAGSLVAYLDRAGLHLRDLAAGSDRLVALPRGAPSWFALGPLLVANGCCDQLGAFAPDGGRLALYVHLSSPQQPGVAIVDVAKGEASLLPGSTGATPLGCLPCVGWSSSGWLFFFAGAPPPTEIVAWRPDRREARLLDLALDSVGGAVPGGLAAG
jgi:hypothetical protein